MTWLTLAMLIVLFGTIAFMWDMLRDDHKHDRQ